MMKEVAPLPSIGSPEFDTTFWAYPEFGTYVREHGRADLILTAG